MTNPTTDHYEKIVQRLAHQLIAANGTPNPQPIDFLVASQAILNAIPVVGLHLMARLGRTDAFLDAFNSLMTNAPELLRQAKQIRKQDEQWTSKILH